MVITIDVGNTNITVGVFRGDEVMATFRITTKMPRTSDEYGMLLSNLLEQNKIRHDDIEDAIIASVVPNVMHSLEVRSSNILVSIQSLWSRVPKQESAW